MLVTADHLRWAERVITKEQERVLRGKTFRLRAPIVLPVKVRGQRPYTKDEAFAGTESFTVSGVVLLEDSYNKRKSVVILKPTWATDFSTLELTIDRAIELFYDFDEWFRVAMNSTNADVEKARKIITKAGQDGVVNVSVETTKDERFGSW